MLNFYSPHWFMAFWLFFLYVIVEISYSWNKLQNCSLFSFPTYRQVFFYERYIFFERAFCILMLVYSLDNQDFVTRGFSLRQLLYEGASIIFYFMFMMIAPQLSVLWGHDNLLSICSSWKCNFTDDFLSITPFSIVMAFFLQSLW